MRLCRWTIAMMSTDEPSITKVRQEAAALGQALAIQDFDGTRHRSRLITTLATIYGMDAVYDAAHDLLDQLGPSKASSPSNYAQAMKRLTIALDQMLE